ncbi:Cyclin-like domain-containing protein [Madurella fahalii]|uniref:RNA polymerase II holoenzyme cyclin-like subunit n=1 Tax=Madurella fahalii TaxID=1157608 RepID=A0ABQ0FYN8_9PEZI
MSNIDRYRPPREGYQPPSLPPKPPPAVPDRSSKSPFRRRDVPPAVPSPPTLSSRTSPPRPHSRRSAPSPAQSSPRQASQPRPDQWYFTLDEVASSPSIIEGLSPAEERLRRAKGVNFIYQAGILLELPQITLWVAGVFFHRFYMRYSMVEEKAGIHHYNIAATALFLANKTEENCRKTKDVIIAVAKVAQKNAKLVIDEQSKEYWRWRDSILTYEELMLETLTFDLVVDNPYARLYEHFSLLDLVHNKTLRDAAWAFCNDACLTVLPLLLPARDVSVAAIFWATSVTRDKIDDVHGEAWWHFLKASESNTIQAVDLMTAFYKENPLRKQDAKVPGSPEFNLESTRRRGELSLSQMDLDSAASQYGGTPAPSGTDRAGTQSPTRAGTRVNGRAGQGEKAAAGGAVVVKSEDVDAESGVKNGEMRDLEAASRMSRGDSDAALKAAANDLSSHERGANGDARGGGGLVSPGVKRWGEGGGEEREPKRAKLEDEDEGEIKGS